MAADHSYYALPLFNMGFTGLLSGRICPWVDESLFRNFPEEEMTTSIFLPDPDSETCGRTTVMGLQKVTTPL